jgi:hypothetical protein
MNAAPAHDLPGRGAPRLLRHVAALECLKRVEGPCGRARLETEVGWDLAQLLVEALAHPGSAAPAEPR